LKPERSASPKAAIVRRPYRPGQHGQRRHTVSDFGKQLNEKQKMLVIYGVTNKYLAKLFSVNPDKTKALAVLEHRLDHVVFLLGLAGSVRVARQTVSHGHITVNGRKVTIPSFHVKVGDVVAVRPESRKLKLFAELSDRLMKQATPAWLKITSAEEGKGECIKAFDVAEAQFPFDLKLVGEFYSR
jgi:small subunit ribosomal protein S4